MEFNSLKTACMFWPGSEAPIQGIRPSYFMPYDSSMAATARVDQVLTWLGFNSGERPQFITLYFEGVDTAGHSYGPDSVEVRGKGKGKLKLKVKVKLKGKGKKWPMKSVEWPMGCVE